MNLVEAMKTGEEFREAGKSVRWKCKKNTLMRKPNDGYWYSDGSSFFSLIYDKEFELVEKKPKKLGRLYVCIKDYKVINPVEKQYLVGDCVITNKADDELWQPCITDDTGTAWSCDE